MATALYFAETIKDPSDKKPLAVELGRFSFDQDNSIYLTVDGKTVIMDRATAKRFVAAVISVGHYHGLIDRR